MQLTQNLSGSMFPSTHKFPLFNNILVNIINYRFHAFGKLQIQKVKKFDFDSEMSRTTHFGCPVRHSVLGNVNFAHLCRKGSDA